MKKLKHLALPFLVLTVLAGTQLASANTEDEVAETGPNGPNNENHQLLKEALDNNDYQAFLEVAPDEMLEVINEGNFARLIEAHEYMNVAHENMESAKAIYEELGLKGPMGQGMKGPKGPRGNMDPEKMEAMKTAIENQDYAAWAELAPKKLQEQITEENFAQFCEAHQLMANGDMEGAQTIFDSLGIERPMKKGPRGNQE